MLPRILLALSLSPLMLAAPQQVEPGLRLTSALTVIEHPASGDPIVSAMHATKVGSNAHTGSNFARGLVYSGQQNTVEIDGVTSSLILQTTTPTFYVHVDPEDPSDQRAMFTLVRLKPSKDTRVAITFTANTFGGGRKRHIDEVPVAKSDAGNDVLKVTPQSPLTAGEYGLLMLPADSKTFPDRVYAFTVPLREK
ncbi:hypothetical protein [Granulicella paludicola]|uniref:hypothetical protein n=1 Tax=Granulicella paludicola TaxID=474951 RepID=UPI0021E03521|nr:hypothetical protein [Granulicella paludicola]